MEPQKVSALLITFKFYILELESLKRIIDMNGYWISICGILLLAA